MSFDETQFCKIIFSEGFEESMAFLERELSAQCKLLDACGYILYPTTKGDPSDLIIRATLPGRPEVEIVKMLSELQSGEFEYSPSRNYLYYAVGKSGSRGYLVVDVKTTEEVERLEKILPNTVLGLSSYLAGYYASSKKQHEFEDHTLRYLFANGAANLVTFARDKGVCVDVDQVFSVSVLSIDYFSGSKVHREYLRNTTLEYFNSRKRECLVSMEDDKMVIFLPQQNKEGRFERDGQWLPRKCYKELNQFIESRFPVRINSGIGRPKPVHMIEEGYREALIALTMPKFLGDKHYAQFYDELDSITVLFSHCYDEYKAYTLRTLRKLFDYDEQHNIYLFDTLTSLISNNFNRKNTAEAMYIHVNTLKYRTNKIEEILGIDMNNFFDLAQLYQMMLFYYTIKENGWIET